jgi:hypothetical protein
VTERRRPIDDPEILELLKEEPELLAIADAIAATQWTGRRRRLPARALALAAVVATALVTVSVVELTGRGPGLAERALAAIGDGRVVHLVATRDEGQQMLVDLRDGTARPIRITVETWFDSETGEARTTTRREGALIADSLSRAEARTPAQLPIPPDPAIATFAHDYRDTLARGGARIIRRSELDGVRVVWLVLSPSRGRTDEVALSEKTNLPVAFRLVVPGERASDLWRVSVIGSKARVADDFAPSPAAGGPISGRVEGAQAASLAEAADLLRGRALWPGRDPVGLQLRSIQAQTLTRSFAGGPTERGTGLALLYRNEAGAFVEIREALDPEPAYGFTEGRLTLGFAPIPEEDALVLVMADSNGSIWLGQFRRAGVYVTIRGSSRDLVIEAAGALRPIR